MCLFLDSLFLHNYPISKVVGRYVSAVDEREPHVFNAYNAENKIL
jgi:hypothetical protein